VVETARVLLMAGSSTSGPTNCNPLDILLAKTSSLLSNFVQYRSSPRLYINKFLLISELTNLLLVHGAWVTETGSRMRYCKFSPINSYRLIIRILDSRQTHIFIFFIASALVEEREFKERRQRAVTQDSINAILEILGEMFRCFSLAWSGVSDADLFTDTFIDDEQFLLSFVIVAGYSGQSAGHSSKLILLVLNSLTASQVNRLCGRLSKVIGWGTDQAFGWANEPSITDAARNKLCAYTKNALDLVREVDPPLGLLHLARRAITRAMSNRCLSDVSTLGLPGNIMKYVQLHIH